MNVLEAYRSYRFSLEVENGDAVEPATAKYGLIRVWSDPFALDRVWLGAAHAAGRAALYELLLARDNVRIVFHDREHHRRRVIVVAYERAVSLPFDLDATLDSVALEWVVLLSAACSPAIEEVDAPEVLPGVDQ